MVTGDPSQTDLLKKEKSDLGEIPFILKGLDDVKIIEFENLDVVRHPLVQKILERYDNYGNGSS